MLAEIIVQFAQSFCIDNFYAKSGPVTFLTGPAFDGVLEAFARVF